MQRSTIESAIESFVATTVSNSIAISTFFVVCNLTARPKSTAISMIEDLRSQMQAQLDTHIQSYVELESESSTVLCPPEVLKQHLESAGQEAMNTVFAQIMRGVSTLED